MALRKCLTNMVEHGSAEAHVFTVDEANMSTNSWRKVICSGRTTKYTVRFSDDDMSPAAPVAQYSDQIQMKMLLTLTLTSHSTLVNDPFIWQGIVPSVIGELGGFCHTR